MDIYCNLKILTDGKVSTIKEHSLVVIGVAFPNLFSVPTFRMFRILGVPTFRQITVYHSNTFLLSLPYKSFGITMLSCTVLASSPTYILTTLFLVTVLFVPYLILSYTLLHPSMLFILQTPLFAYHTTYYVNI